MSLRPSDPSLPLDPDACKPASVLSTEQFTAPATASGTRGAGAERRRALQLWRRGAAVGVARATSSKPRVRGWGRGRQAGTPWVHVVAGCGCGCATHEVLEAFVAQLPRSNAAGERAHVLWVVGCVAHKQVARLQAAYAALAAPKWCVAVGACAASGGLWRSGQARPGLAGVLPVDVFVPGCPVGRPQLESALALLAVQAHDAGAFAGGPSSPDTTSGPASAAVANAASAAAPVATAASTQATTPSPIASPAAVPSTSLAPTPSHTPTPSPASQNNGLRHKPAAAAEARDEAGDGHPVPGAPRAAAWLARLRRHSADVAWSLDEWAGEGDAVVLRCAPQDVSALAEALYACFRLLPLDARVVPEAGSGALQPPPPSGATPPAPSAPGGALVWQWQWRMLGANVSLCVQTEAMPAASTSLAARWPAFAWPEREAREAYGLAAAPQASPSLLLPPAKATAPAIAASAEDVASHAAASHLATAAVAPPTRPVSR